MVVSRFFGVLALAGCLLQTPIWAQSRFQAIAQDAVPGVPGLRVVTVRDTELATCFALFIAEPTPAETVEPNATASSSTDDEIGRAHV